MEESIMDMEHLVIITITILQKWAILLTEPPTQITMDHPQFPSNNRSPLWSVPIRKLKCKNQQSTFQSTTTFKMLSWPLGNIVIVNNQDTAEVIRLIMLLQAPMDQALFTIMCLILTINQLDLISSVIWTEDQWTLQALHRILSLLPPNKKELHRKTMWIFNNK